MSNGLKVLDVKAYEDGSAWAAVVVVGGITYTTTYINNLIRVALAPYKKAPKKVEWHLKYVRDWSKEQVSLLPSVWHVKHTAMYSEDCVN